MSFVRRPVVRLLRGVAAYEELCRATAERERRNAELERRLAERTTELEVAVRELAAFSYTVSHDLRAPLRAIDGFSQAVLEDHGDQLDPQARADLGRVNAASKRMGEMIEGLLQLARMIRVDLERGPIDVSGLARNIVDDLQRREPARAIEVVIGDGCRGHGDLRLIRIVLQQLIGNAWKFTQRAATPRVEIGVDPAAGPTTYFVRDNGVGFDMKYAERLFQPFQRLHGASEFPGTGIGLATVQRIVARHGGRVWAEAAPGAGATFWFSLPGAPDPG